MLLDVTRPLGPRTEPWPGDTPCTWRLTAALGQGGSPANVGEVTTGTHVGTHVDAPWHVLPGGARVDALPLAPFVGPCVVVDARGPGTAVEPSEALLARLDGASRVLFRTRDRGAPHALPKAFAGLAPGLAEELARRRVALAGTDAPSLDAPAAADLPSHRVLAAAGVMLLEGLDLRAAQPGAWELIALPLRLEGLDGSPVRAVLGRPPGG